MATRISTLNSNKGGGTYGGGEGVAQSLDNNTGTKLCNTNFSTIAPFWMIVDAGAVYYPSTYYYIYSANDSPERDPRNWLIQGSNDLSNWTTIDTVTNHGSWGGRNQQESFNHDLTTSPFRYYRWWCSANQSGSIMQISELQIFREGLARYITVSTVGSGSVTPGSGYVADGSSPAYTITPASGWQIKEILRAGVAQTITNKNGMVYTMTSVAADTTLAVTFERKKPGFFTFM